MGRNTLASNELPSLSSRQEIPSEYVLARRRNLAKNAADLQALGIGITRASLSPTSLPATIVGSTSSQPAVKRKSNAQVPTKPLRMSKRTCRKKACFQDEQYEEQRQKVTTLYATTMQQQTANHQLILTLPDGECVNHGPLPLSWQFVANDGVAVSTTAIVDALAGGYICLVRDHRLLHDVYWLNRSLTLLEARQQRVVVDIPSFVGVGGKYRLEVGCTGQQVAITEAFLIARAVGATNSDVGVWCACQHTTYRVTANYVGEWIACSGCLAWQHSTCCNKTDREALPFYCQWCRLENRLAKRHVAWLTDVNSGGVGEMVVVVAPTVQESGLNQGDGGGVMTVVNIEVVESATTDSLLSSTAPVDLPPVVVRSSLLPSPHVTPPLIPPMLVFNTVGTAKERRRYVQIVCSMFDMMTKYLMGNYQRVHDSNIICSTPPNISFFLGQLANGITTTHVVELGAGTGALTVNLPTGVVAYELRQERIDVAKTKAPHAVFRNSVDVLTKTSLMGMVGRNECFAYDLVVSNPDFEVGLSFIYLGLQLMSFKTDARMLFLLPSDFFVGSTLRNRVYKLLDCHIVHEYKLGHVGYYDKNRRKQKKTCDSIFVLKRGRAGKHSWTTTNAVGAGMV
tara:strand:- start:102 stop:1976 length:1875 start_codon:yes stop_codon:yes gene_type:complete